MNDTNHQNLVIQSEEKTLRDEIGPKEVHLESF